MSDNADLIQERERLLWWQGYYDAELQAVIARLDEINQTLNPAQYEPQNHDTYPRHGET